MQIHGARLNTKQRNCHCVQNREECVIQQDLKVIIFSFIIFTKLENSDLNILIKAKKPMQAYSQGLSASEKKNKKKLKKILYNTTRGRTHLLPFFLSRRVKLIVTSERLNIFKKCFHQSKVK